VPGSEYLNISIAGCAEIAAHLCVGALFLRLGPMKTFVLGYSITIIGGGLLVFQNKFAEHELLVAGFVIFAKFGASMAYCCC